MTLRIPVVVAIAALVGLTGCGDDDDTPAGLANPASEYCVAQGGESLITTAEDGSQSGLCRLPDGTVVDEWEFFRESEDASTDESSSTAAPETSAVDESTATTASVEETSGTAAPDPTANPEGPVDYDVYLLLNEEVCDEIVARPRTSTVEGMLGDAMTQLLAGPTDEELAEGLGSWFSADTAGMLRGIEIEDGVARISFATELRETIPNASSSCGSAGFLAQIDATATQFDTVDRAIYSLDGDVTAFYEWLQRSAPE